MGRVRVCAGPQVLRVSESHLEDVASFLCNVGLDFRREEASPGLVVLRNDEAAEDIVVILVVCGTGDSAEAVLSLEVESRADLDAVASVVLQGRGKKARTPLFKDFGFELEGPGGLRVVLSFKGEVDLIAGSISPLQSPSSIAPPIGPACPISLMEFSGPMVAQGAMNGPSLSIDNDFFVGRVLLMMKDPLSTPSSPAPYSCIFEGKKRTFELQVQGQFKKEVDGDVFISVEITQKMKLGLLAMGMCKVLLKFAQSLNKRLYYSFGDESGDVLPHIAFPLMSNVDSLVITSPGQTPPKLGERFEEEPSAKRDRKVAGFGNFRPGGYTYSFSFHSMYIDLARWSTSNIPVMRDMDLHTFCGQSDLRMCAYYISNSAALSPVHSQSVVKYILRLGISHFTNHSETEDELSLDEPFDQQERPRRELSIPGPQLSDAIGPDSFYCSYVDAGEEVDGERDDTSVVSDSESTYFSAGDDSEALSDELKTAAPAHRATCPAYLDLYDKSPKAKQLWTVYCCVWGERLRMRHAKHFNRRLPMSLAADALDYSPRLASREIDRRRFNYVLSAVATPSTVHTFMESTTQADTSFESSVCNMDEGIQDFIIRIISEHHASIERVAITETAVVLKRHKKLTLLIDLDAVIDVRVVESGPITLPGFVCVELSTLGMVHYFLLRQAMAHSWAQSIIDAQTSPSLEAGIPVVNDSCREPKPSFVMKKSCWKGSNRWILNCRTMDVAGATGPQNPLSSPHPVTVVGGLLRQAIALSNSPFTGDPSELVEFLNGTTSLKGLILSGLGHKELLAFLLNLYHLMILHSYFLFGPPSTSLRWASYFTTLCYEINGEVVSIAELEHNVLRARMGAPRLFMSNLFIPSGSYPFSLQLHEPRINFCLNCGASSGIPEILVYTPEELDQQMDCISQLFLRRTVEVNLHKRTVLLPKILSWYGRDFASSTSDLLYELVKYTSGSVQVVLTNLLSDGKGEPSVKFRPFDWHCQKLRLLQA